MLLRPLVKTTTGSASSTDRSNQQQQSSSSSSSSSSPPSQPSVPLPIIDASRFPLIHAFHRIVFSQTAVDSVKSMIAPSAAATHPTHSTQHKHNNNTHHQHPNQRKPKIQTISNNGVSFDSRHDSSTLPHSSVQPVEQMDITISGQKRKRKSTAIDIALSMNESDLTTTTEAATANGGAFNLSDVACPDSPYNDNEEIEDGEMVDNEDENGEEEELPHVEYYSDEEGDESDDGEMNNPEMVTEESVPQNGTDDISNMAPITFPTPNESGAVVLSGEEQIYAWQNAKEQAAYERGYYEYLEHAQNNTTSSSSPATTTPTPTYDAVNHDAHLAGLDTVSKCWDSRPSEVYQYFGWWTCDQEGGWKDPNLVVTTATGSRPAKFIRYADFNGGEGEGEGDDGIDKFADAEEGEIEDGELEDDENKPANSNVPAFGESNGSMNANAGFSFTFPTSNVSGYQYQQQQETVMMDNDFATTTTTTTTTSTITNSFSHSTIPAPSTMQVSSIGEFEPVEEIPLDKVWSLQELLEDVAGIDDALLAGEIAVAAVGDGGSGHAVDQGGFDDGEYADDGEWGVEGVSEVFENAEENDGGGGGGGSGKRNKRNRKKNKKGKGGAGGFNGGGGGNGWKDDRIGMEVEKDVVYDEADLTPEEIQIQRWSVSWRIQRAQEVRLEEEAKQREQEAQLRAAAAEKAEMAYRRTKAYKLQTYPHIFGSTNADTIIALEASLNRAFAQTGGRGTASGSLRAPGWISEDDRQEERELDLVDVDEVEEVERDSWRVTNVQVDAERVPMDDDEEEEEGAIPMDEETMAEIAEIERRLEQGQAGKKPSMRVLWPVIPIRL
ncbi:hypothetical protein HDU76_010728 [Blyttiomyces sp. JEL0837]|nr:hypothetical protein HDU76_010728 [Blyttiomyces sp. JEL0837]